MQRHKKYHGLLKFLLFYFRSFSNALDIATSKQNSTIDWKMRNFSECELFILPQKRATL